MKKEIINDNLLSITKYLVEKHKILLSVKIQKILYFLFLDYLKEYNSKLFEEEFEAWVYGPVIPRLFNHIREHGFDFTEYYDYDEEVIKEIKPLDNNDLINNFIDEKIINYKKMTTEKLVEMSHNTLPWIKARNGIISTEPSKEKIKFNELKKYSKIWSI